MPDFLYGLGDEVECKITGFVGIAIGRHQWLNNCNTYSVKPQTLKDGVPQPSVNFDEPELKLVTAQKINEVHQGTGGPDRPVQQPNRL